MSSLETSYRSRSEGGLYDISFFAASVSHPVAVSRDVFGRLSDGMLSQFAGEWAKLGEADRQAYLLETHEMWHHALMFSTPAGVLLWRLNQVISRDISYLFQQAREMRISFPPNRSPSETLNDPGWQTEFQNRADVAAGKRAYILYIIRSLSDVIRVRSVFFDRDGAATNSHLTVRELIAVMERTFAYLEERCEVRFVKKWKTRLPADAKVFPEGKAFNVMDIAEAHAIAGELFALRAFQDMDGFERRRQAAANGPFGAAFTVGVAATASVNAVGISPHQVQLMALVACASALEVAEDETRELMVEDVLPWWRFTSPDVLKPDLFINALRNWLSLSTSPLIDAGSRWVSFRDLSRASKNEDHEAKGKRFADLVTSLQSLSLDLQIHAIHKGAMLNVRYLMTVLAESNPKMQIPGAGFERLTDGDWRNELLLTIPLIEYSDEFLFPGQDLDDIYKPGNPLRNFRLYKLLQHPGYQLLGHILNGATTRTLYAAYARRLIPRSEVLRPKFEKLVTPDIAKSMCDIVANLFERGGATGVDLAHLNVLPEYIPAKLYIC